MEKCRVCQEPADKRCAKCKGVSYCSVEHQKSDWKQHKSTCRIATNQSETYEMEGETSSLSADEIISKMEKSFREPAYFFELLEDGVDQGDLYMFANRNLQPGDLIFNEPPAVLCPILQPDGNNEHQLPCWGCGKSIRGGKTAVYRCSKCGLSVCSTDCENLPTHKQNECRIIKQMKAKQKRRGMTDDALWKQYLDISVLRFLLCREKQSQRWEYFQNLKSSSRANIYSKRPNCGADIVGNDLKLSLMYTNNDTELVSLACKLLNTFSEVINFGDSHELRALYCFLSCVQHDCVGNMFSVYDSNTQLLTMKAAVAIKKGELLTYDFLGNIWASTMTRVVSLLELNIICTCFRCSDSTEFGTFCSSFRCSKCETGFYLPIEPDPTAPVLEKSSKEILLWKCQTECGDTIPYEFIHNYVETAQRDYAWEKDFGSENLGQAALKFYNNMPKNHKSLGPMHSLTLEVMDDYLHYDRISHERRDYLKLGTDTTHTDQDIENFRRKRDFAERLVIYLNKVKKDCIHPKKCYVYVEYGFYNIITVSFDYKKKRAKRSDVIDALELAVDLWRKARQMLVYLRGNHDPVMPDYTKIIDNLSVRFATILHEDELLIPFLMTELRIEWSTTDGDTIWNTNNTKEHKD